MIVYNYYFAVLILSLIFFYISTKSISILLSIIIVGILGYYYFNNISNYNNSLITNFNNNIKLLTDDIKDRDIVNDDNYILNKFPNNIIYLKHDKFLVQLLLNIRFIKIFDDAKYTNIINYFEKFMKIYIFMLGDRYDIQIHFTTFTSLRISIIKELYSIYIIVPDKFIYIYNINPFKEIQKTIYEFMKHTRKMIIIIEKYAFNKKGIKYLEDTKYKAYQKNNYEVF